MKIMYFGHEFNHKPCKTKQLPVRNVYYKSTYIYTFANVYGCSVKYTQSNLRSNYILQCYYNHSLKWRL